MKALVLKRGLVLLGFVCFLSIFKTQSQQDPVFSQYMMNAYLINPAIAGSAGYTEFCLTAREQWVGFKGTPKTHAICGQTRILRNSFINKNASVKKKHRLSSRSGRVGLGGYIFNDRTGAIGRTGFQGTYSYHIDMHSSQLSFGISTKAYQYKLHDGIELPDADDNFFFNKDKVYFVPDANFGVYFTGYGFNGGVSSSNVFQSKLRLWDKATMKESEDITLRSYYMLGGYSFTIDNEFGVEPSFLLKINNIGSAQMDLNAKVYYKDDYWTGLSFRTGEKSHKISDFVVMGGLRVDNIYFGYAFDYATSEIMAHTFGSHEFMIAMKFGDNARRYRWLNRY
ncbi:MAG: PorP/SprF family type IX secretion system membrane protein [Bacteroidales bacterium]|nr:PorP/SprF family type IX secretion system membrane protein [Bacteroidales bacterium]